MLGTVISPGCIDYSASKLFVSFLAQGLSYELGAKVDCMVWLSGPVNYKGSVDAHTAV